VSFSDLAEKLELLLGIPSRPTRPRQKMQRRRRGSGSHHV
jgi:hypothetical protein